MATEMPTRLAVTPKPQGTAPTLRVSLPPTAPTHCNSVQHPENEYGPGSGTSSATPMVAGTAAVLKTYFPKLNPADLKRIILQSAVVYHTPVVKPGTKQKVDFATLSKTGGIVNLYEAVKLAVSDQAASAPKR